MNKIRLILIAMMLGAFLLVGTTPAAAHQPEPGGGFIEYIPTIVDMRLAGGNTIMTTTEAAEYHGTLEGAFTDTGFVVIHPAGNWTYRAVGTFVGSVAGKTGTLEIMMVGSRPDAYTEWQGTWVITGGTGDLKNLHGQGTFWGWGYTGSPTPTTPGRIDYEGITHFVAD